MANNSKSLALYLRYETTFRRSYDRALNNLLRRRSKPKESAPSEPHEPQEPNLRNDPKPLPTESPILVFPIGASGPAPTSQPPVTAKGHPNADARPL